MNKAWWLARQCLMLVAVVWSAASAAEDSLTVSNAWVREAPPKAEESAAYLTIHNKTNQAHKLVGVSSPQFQKAEIHDTEVTYGKAHMRRVGSLPIEAHGTVEFKAGAYHLMLISPLQPLKAGNTVELRLQFDDVPQITVQAPIRKADDADETPHRHDMNDMKM